MKIRKSAKQRNVELDTTFYEEYEVVQMCENKELYLIGKFPIYNRYGDLIDYRYITSEYLGMDKDYRIDLCMIDELKVILGEDKFYQLVAVSKTGKQYHVKL